MEVNKDEAQRCVDIAVEALKNNNFPRAEKFLTKANNLFPTQKAKELLERLRTNQNQHQFNDDGVRNRSKNTTYTFKAESSKTKTTSSSGSGTETKEYTKEQHEMCRRIKICKDYYEVLNVTKEATDTEIKKSYKKLALQLHPDKNRAPGAVEAFKALGNAAGVLTDPEKRKNYDLYGNENTNNRIHHSRHHYHANHEYEHAYRNANSFESDFTAEELFNMFFGNGFPQTRTDNNRRYHARQEANREYHHQQQQPSLAFGIILVLILISMMSSFFTSDPIYSLAPSAKYAVLRKTIHLNIPYYVKDKFETDYQGSLARLENSVEEEYILVMKQACYRERSYREIMMARARSFGNEQQLEQARSLKVTSCENLARIGLTKFMPA